MLRIAALAAIIASALLGAATPALAERPRDCTAEELAPEAAPAGTYYPPEVEDHRQFEIPAVTYTFDQGPKHWNLEVNLLVDDTGHVTCIELPPWGDEPPEMTLQRLAVLDQVGEWTYAPFKIGGEPASARVLESVREEERPAAHIAMPEGDLAKASITLTRSNCYGPCPAYSVKIAGSGKVEFMQSAFVDVPGRRKYSIAPKDAAALFQMARDKDIWSMRDSYEADTTDGAIYTLRIDIGGKTKTITDYFGWETGMPGAVSEMENAVDKAAETDVFIHFQTATFPYLEAEHFKFRGQAGANLLVSSVSADDEDALIRLVELGAPLQGGKRYEYGRAFEERPVVSLAIKARHDRLLDALLAHDALTPGGIPYQTQIDDAFQAAVESGQMRYVERIWPYSPRTTVKAKAAWDGTRPADYPVCLKLARDWEYPQWNGLDIVTFLFDHGACDVTGRDEQGRTIMHVAADLHAIDLIPYLVKLGADVNAKSEYEKTPLLMTFDEDTIIALLEAGADPTIKDQFDENTLQRVADDDMPRVQAWLTAHGSTLPAS